MERWTQGLESAEDDGKLLQGGSYDVSRSSGGRAGSGEGKRGGVEVIISIITSTQYKIN